MSDLSIKTRLSMFAKGLYRNGNERSAEKLQKIVSEMDNGWISVDDRLPEVGQTVDVYMKKKRFACNRLTDVRWMKSLNKFRATRTGRHYNLEQISHWMPLPEPPTK